ncbi:MAG: YfbM family protein [Chitinophagaceae bacterium]
MSMIGYLFRVSNEQLESFLEDSNLLESFIDEEIENESDSMVDLDKSWDAINFMLTGKTLEEIADAEPPLGMVLFSGQAIDEEQDLGYGPAQYLTPEQVKEVDYVLSNISRDEFCSRYAAGTLNELGVYPESWTDEEDILTYLADNFESLKGFYADAASEDEAVISYIG